MYPTSLPSIGYNEEVVMKRPQRIILKLYFQTVFDSKIINIFGYMEKKQRQKSTTKGEKIKQVKNEWMINIQIYQK